MVTTAAAADEWLCTFWWAFVGACALGSGAAPSWARRAVAPLVARGKVDARDDDADANGPTTKNANAKAATRWATAWRVPHAWFKHFYVVGCCVNAIALMGSSGNAGGAASDASRLALGLFQVHLIRRLCESAFVSSYRAGASMHAASYALGLAYYVCASQSWAWRTPTTASGGLFNFDDASETHGGGAAGGTTAGVLLLALKCIGVVLFAVGNREQHRCHVILAESRRAKSSRSARTKRSYVIPRGGWFERFSCAHYTAEIVIYLGLLTIVLPPRIAPLFINPPDRYWRLVLRVVAAPASMCLAVCANLTLAAHSHHAWYLDAFGEDYPRHRTAIFPSLSFRHPKPSSSSSS
jgi:3-oxo-5-alpha-steroid 4-dehydrogenase 3